MATIDTGGPAFPCIPPLAPDGVSASGYPFPSEGVTIRDYFAAKAMQGDISGFSQGYMSVEEVADRAYTLADAMLKRREL